MVSSFNLNSAYKLRLYKFSNDRLYDWNSKIKIRLYLSHLTILIQVAKLNFMLGMRTKFYV